MEGSSKAALVEEKHINLCEKSYICDESNKQVYAQNDCVPYEVAESPTLGRHLVATKDIPAGTVIMRKKPLVLGPKLISYPLCLGCHKKLDTFRDDPYHCRRCGWLLCGRTCENTDFHVEECAVFAKSGFKPDVLFDDVKQTAYCCVTPLRCLLLREKDKDQYDQLMSYQSHLEENFKTQFYQILRRHIVPIFMQELQMDIEEEEILKICSILDTNCFDVRDSAGQINIRGM